MIGLRRTVEIEGISYSIYQLPCSDEIEIDHPEGFNYLVSSLNKGKYTILGHFLTFPEAELFLIEEIQSKHKKSIERINLVKHRLFDGQLFSTITKEKVSDIKFV